MQVNGDYCLGQFSKICSIAYNSTWKPAWICARQINLFSNTWGIVRLYFRLRYGRYIYNVVMIDFRTALDVIRHDILVHKLIAVNARERSVRWIASFLSSRKQLVCLHEKYSAVSDVPCWIAQGNVVELSLFALYINDLSESSPDCKIKFFATDVKT